MLPSGKSPVVKNPVKSDGDVSSSSEKPPSYRSKEEEEMEGGEDKGDFEMSSVVVEKMEAEKGARNHAFDHRSEEFSTKI